MTKEIAPGQAKKEEKMIPDPGKGKPPEEAKLARIKAWKRPAAGDADPDDSKKKLTKAKAKQLDDAGRAARRAAWEARR